MTTSNTTIRRTEPGHSENRRGPLLILSVALLLLATLLFARSALARPDCALLYRIGGPEDVAGYLFGTIHAEDPRIMELPAIVREAFEDSESFAMEVVPDAEALFTLAQRMHFQDGRNLKSVVGEDLFRRVVDALSSYGVGKGMAIKMKPWAVAMTLSVPPPESGIFLDMRLYLDARNVAKPVYGLETVEEQLAFLEALDESMQIQLLEDSVNQLQGAGDAFEALINAYLSADLDTLEALNRQQLKSTPPELSNWLMEQGIERRNHRMLEELLGLLDDKRTFAAVGALHLPGAEGLIELLRKRGFEVSRVGRSGAECASAAGALE